MLKKILQHGFPQKLRDYWRDMAHSSWTRISRGAAQRSRMFSYPHGNEGLRRDKVQAGHNPQGHKSHRDR